MIWMPWKFENLWATPGSGVRKDTYKLDPQGAQLARAGFSASTQGIVGDTCWENHSVPRHPDIGICSRVTTWLQVRAPGSEGGRQACAPLHFVITHSVPTKCYIAGRRGRQQSKMLLPSPPTSPRDRLKHQVLQVPSELAPGTTKRGVKGPRQRSDQA